MEVKENLNIKSLIQGLKFQATSGSDAQNSFMSLLDLSVPAPKTGSGFFEASSAKKPQPVDVKKDELLTTKENNPPKNEATTKPSKKDSKDAKSSQETKEDQKTSSNEIKDKGPKEANVVEKAEPQPLPLVANQVPTTPVLSQEAPLVENNTDLAEIIPTEEVVIAAQADTEQGVAEGDGFEKITTISDEMTAEFAKTATDFVDAAKLPATDKIDLSQIETQAKIAEEPLTPLVEQGTLNIDTDADIKLKKTKPEITVAQEQELSSMLKDKTNVDIKVSVQEEGFSYSKPNTLIFDDNNQQASEEVIKESDTINPILDTSAFDDIAPQSPKVDFAQAVAVAQISEPKAPITSSNDNINPLGIESVKSSKVQTREFEQKINTDDKTKALSKDAINQIKVNITKSAVKGIDVIDIQLKPENLGKLSIKMEITKDGKIEAHIIASQKETVDMLQKDLGSLQKAFSDAGFTTDDNFLSFSHKQEENNPKQNRLSFMAEALSEEKEQEPTLLYNGNQALNIKV